MISLLILFKVLHFKYKGELFTNQTNDVIDKLRSYCLKIAHKEDSSLNSKVYLSIKLAWHIFKFIEKKWILSLYVSRKEKFQTFVLLCIIF